MTLSLLYWTIHKPVFSFQRRYYILQGCLLYKYPQQRVIIFSCKIAKALETQGKLAPLPCFGAGRTFLIYLICDYQAIIPPQEFPSEVTGGRVGRGVDMENGLEFHSNCFRILKES